MGEFLFGGTQSGTPVETRAGTRQFGNFFESLLRGGGDTTLRNIVGPFQNLTQDALTQAFGGQDPNAILRDLLIDPAEATTGLFASLRPFEQRETEEAVAGTRNLFGSLGGRFSRNVGRAEADTRGRLAEGFARTREQSLLSAQAQRGQLALGLGDLANRNLALQLSPLELMTRFLQPGAPVQTEGILPGLLSSGINLFGLSKFLGGRGGGNS